jgi:hypothetical protein
MGLRGGEEVSAIVANQDNRLGGIPIRLGLCSVSVYDWVAAWRQSDEHSRSTAWIE